MKKPFFVEALEKNDPELLRQMNAMKEFAEKDGALPAKIKTLMSLLTIAALTFAVGIGIATDARAEIRIAAVVYTPNVSVHAGYNPSRYYHIRQDRRLPYRRYMRYEITRRDRMIARRMAWYTAAYGWEN